MTAPPGEVFGAVENATPRVTHQAKLAELRRELALRKSVYAKQVERGNLDPAKAAAQIALIEAVISDYEIRPWPNTVELVKTWRDAAEPLTVLGIRATKMHREELLAVLAFAVDALKRAGLLGETKPAPGETKGPERETPPA
jgi:hypothetical protein